jgi:3,4-dihydroxy 2-butanone 4-phosphate synthase
VFTGRIDEIGLVEKIEAGQLMVRAPRSVAALRAGGSVCVDGVRLTVHQLAGEVFAAAITRETCCRSAFDALAEGRPVNVEVPLTAGASPAAPAAHLCGQTGWIEWAGPAR